MTEIIAVALFTLLAVISPGADFAMVTRSSYAQGRKAGLAAAIGIALGVQVHVLYTVLGIAVIISQSPALFLVMKVLGAGYLIYLGYKSLTNTTRIRLDGLAHSEVSVASALRTGFLTNALNPKTMLFVISDEVIPETHRAGFGDSATASLFVGFGLMFFLDVALA